MYRERKMRIGFILSLKDKNLFEPTFPSEVEVDCQWYKNHNNQYGRIAPSLSEFRHELEVHPIDTGNKG